MISTNARVAAGNSPARNSDPTDRLVIDPSTSSMSEGGIVSPMAALAASTAMGETIPPSLMLLVLGSITSLSVGSLFLAGMLPAAVLALVLIAVVIVRSHIHGYFKGPPFRLGRALRSTPPAIPAFLVPVIVVGGIVGGIASPTESATFAVVYGFVASLVVYRTIGLRTSCVALRDAALTAGMVLFMVSASNLVSQAIVI